MQQCKALEALGVDELDSISWIGRLETIIKSFGGKSVEFETIASAIGEER